MKKLCKSDGNKMIAGVCGGLAEYFNLDATVVRLAFVVVTLFWGAGILVYFLAAFIMPSPDSGFSGESDGWNAEVFEKRKDTDENRGRAESRKTAGLHTDEEFDAFFKK